MATVQIQERAYVPYNPEFEKEELQEEREIFPVGAQPMMFSGSSDKRLCNWNLKMGICERSLVGHRGGIMCIAVDWEGGRSQLRDSQRLVLTGSSDFSIMKWENKRQLWLAEYEGHKGTVSKVIADWPNKRFLSSSYDGTVKLWDLDGGECGQTLDGKHTGPVCCVDIDWDTGCVVSGSEDMDIMQWDLEVGECVLSIEGHVGPVWELSMDPESMRILSTGADRTVKLWDLRSGQCIRSMLRHTLPVGVMKVDWESGRAMTGSSDRSMILWDFEQGEELLKIEGHFGGVWALDVDWRGNRCVSGAGPCDNAIKLWDFDLDRGPPYCHETLQEHTECVWDLVVDWEVCFYEKPESSDEEAEAEARYQAAKQASQLASEEAQQAQLAAGTS